MLLHINGKFTMVTLKSSTTDIVPLVVNTSRSFPRSRLITGFVTRLTRRVPLVEQELLTLLEHLSSPPVTLFAPFLLHAVGK
jgi:hypothetical protein